MSTSLAMLTTLMSGVLLGSLFRTSSWSLSQLRRAQLRGVLGIAGRLGVILLGFYVSAGWHLTGLALCLLGFVLARLEMRRLSAGLYASASSSSSSAPDAGSAAMPLSTASGLSRPSMLS